MMTYRDLYDDTDRRRPSGGLGFKIEIWQRWKRWKSRRKKEKADLEKELIKLRIEELEYAGWFDDHRKYITKEQLRELLTEELRRRNG